MLLGTLWYTSSDSSEEETSSSSARAALMASFRSGCERNKKASRLKSSGKGLSAPMATRYALLKCLQAQQTGAQNEGGGVLRRNSQHPESPP